MIVLELLKSIHNISRCTFYDKNGKFLDTVIVKTHLAFLICIYGSKTVLEHNIYQDYPYNNGLNDLRMWLDVEKECN